VKQRKKEKGKIQESNTKGETHRGKNSQGQREIISGKKGRVYDIVE